ncbi:MAG TPA: hypothetical protein VKK81_07840, partial [Candidatus Binatia bacterium]|nr:hypothetical protein [Candidatus Binatia bacterium]
MPPGASSKATNNKLRSNKRTGKSISVHFVRAWTLRDIALSKRFRGALLYSQETVWEMILQRAVGVLPAANESRYQSALAFTALLLVVI